MYNKKANKIVSLINSKAFHTKVILKSGDMLSITNMFNRHIDKDNTIVEVSCFNYLEDLEIFNDYSFGYYNNIDNKWYHWSKRFSNMNPEWVLGNECIEVFENVPIDLVSSFLGLKFKKVKSHVLNGSEVIFNNLFGLTTPTT